MRLQYKDIARDGNGIIISNANIAVYLGGTTTAANVYTSSTSTTAVNSVTSGSDGSFVFYVDAIEYGSDQTYKIVLTATINGIDLNSYTIDNITIEDAVLGNYTISTARTASYPVRIPKGVMYVKSGTGTLTFNATFEAGHYQVFSGFSSGLTFGSNAITCVKPEWFGATGNGTTDDSTAMQSAVSCAVSGLFPVQLSSQYLLGTGIIIDTYFDTPFKFFGKGKNAGFLTSSAINMIDSTLTVTTGPVVGNMEFNNVMFKASANSVNCFVINGSKFFRVVFHGCAFINIRAAASATILQSWVFDNRTWITGFSGVFLAVTGLGGAVPGFIGDVHFTDIEVEGADVADSTFVKTPGEMQGVTFKGGVIESIKGPIVDVAQAITLLFQGVYVEGLTDSALKLGQSLNVEVSSNVFNYGNTAIFAVNCGTSFNITGIANYTNGSLYDDSSMPAGSELVSDGDYAAVTLYNGLTSNIWAGTITLTGFTATITGTANAHKKGNQVSLEIFTAITGTSNATTMTLTGLPVQLLPITGAGVRSVPCYVTDNGSIQNGMVLIGPTSVTFKTAYGGADFTNSGTKGLPAQTINYVLYP